MTLTWSRELSSCSICRCYYSSLEKQRLFILSVIHSLSSSPPQKKVPRLHFQKDQTFDQYALPHRLRKVQKSNRGSQTYSCSANADWKCKLLRSMNLLFRTQRTIVKKAMNEVLPRLSTLKPVTLQIMMIYGLFSIFN